VEACERRHDPQRRKAKEQGRANRANHHRAANISGHHDNARVHAIGKRAAEWQQRHARNRLGRQHESNLYGFPGRHQDRPRERHGEDLITERRGQLSRKEA
jgi:hypothetical protein